MQSDISIALKKKMYVNCKPRTQQMNSPERQQSCSKTVHQWFLSSVKNVSHQLNLTSWCLLNSKLWVQSYLLHTGKAPYKSTVFCPKLYPPSLTYYRPKILHTSSLSEKRWLPLQFGDLLNTAILIICRNIYEYMLTIKLKTDCITYYLKMLFVETHSCEMAVYH